MIGQTDHLSILTRRIQAAWRLTIIACIFAYAFVLHYVVLGIPGIPYQLLTEHYFWRETATEIKQIAEEVRNQTGKEPIVVGMSKWSVASALSFYTHGEGTQLDIRSRNMFGDSGVMYEFWFPSQPPTDRPIIQVGMKRHDLEKTRTGIEVNEMLDRPGTIVLLNDMGLLYVEYIIVFLRDLKGWIYLQHSNIPNDNTNNYRKRLSSNTETTNQTL